MNEVRVIRETDVPEFRINDAKVRHEARRKARVKEEAAHPTVHRQGDVRLFSMDTAMTRYWGVHVDVSSVGLREVMAACNKAALGKIRDVELIVIEFKDHTLVFLPEDGREIKR